MWTPLDIPIEVSRNGTTSISLQLWDSVANEPIDITGETLTCRVARALGESVIASPVVTVVSAASGEFDIAFVGSAFSGVGGLQEIVRLAYEVKSASGLTIMRGPLILIPGI